jgi:hypothetical protein
VRAGDFPENGAVCPGKIGFLQAFGKIGFLQAAQITPFFTDFL